MSTLLLAPYMLWIRWMRAAIPFIFVETHALDSLDAGGDTLQLRRVLGGP
jgi:hypothetical protein